MASAPGSCGVQSERRAKRCPRYGQAPTDHDGAGCPVRPEVTERLVAFKRAHGVRWKAAPVSSGCRARTGTTPSCGAPAI